LALASPSVTTSRQRTVAPRRDVRHAHPESFRLRRSFVSQRRDQ
jgi:hypothetical protein